MNPQIESDVDYSPNKEQVDKDTEALTAGMKAEELFPAFTDEEFDSFDREASILSGAVNAVTKGIKKVTDTTATDKAVKDLAKGFTKNFAKKGSKEYHKKEVKAYEAKIKRMEKDGVEQSVIDEVEKPVEKTLSTIQLVKPREKTDPKELRERPSETKAREVFDTQFKEMEDEIKLNQQASDETIIKTSQSQYEYNEKLEEVASKIATEIGNKTKVLYTKGDKPSYMPRTDVDATIMLKHISSDADIDATTQLLAEGFKGQIDEARRGVITDESLKGLAYDIGMDTDRLKEVLTRPDGTTASAEEILAIRTLFDASGRKLKMLSDAYNLNTIPANAEALQRQILFNGDLLKKFMGYRAESGRSQRSFGVQIEDGMLTREDHERILAMSTQGFSLDKIAKVISSLDDTKGLYSAIDTMSNMKKIVELAKTLFTNSILSGVGTQTINATSGVSNLGFTHLDRFIAGRDTQIRNLFPNGIGRLPEDRVEPLESELFRIGVVNSTLNATKIFTHILKTAERYGSTAKFVEEYTNPLTAEYWGVDEKAVLGQAIDWAGHVDSFMLRRMMSAVDGFTKVIAENGEYLTQAYRTTAKDMREMDTSQYTESELKDITHAMVQELLHHPTNDMIQKSIQKGKEITYQEENIVAQKIKSVVRLFAPFHWMLPFVNTPVNLVNQNLVQRSPLALFRKKMWENSADGQIQKAKFLSSAGLILTVGALIENGSINGSEPLSADAKAVWESENRIANSLMLNIGGIPVQLSYQRLENFVYSLTMIGDAKNLYEAKDLDWNMEDGINGGAWENKDAMLLTERSAELTMLILQSVMATMNDRVGMQGIAKIFDILTAEYNNTNTDSKTKALGRLAVDAVIPTIIPLTSLMKDIDYHILENRDKNDNKEILDKIRASILFLKEKTPNKLGLLGEVLSKPVRGTPIAGGILRTNAVYLEANRLGITTGITFIKPLNRKIEDVTLDPQEYYDYQVFSRAGGELEALLNDALESDDYKDAPNDIQRAIRLSNAVNEHDQKMKKGFLAKQQELGESVRKHPTDKTLLEKIAIRREFNERKKGKEE